MHHCTVQHDLCVVMGKACKWACTHTEPVREMSSLSLQRTQLSTTSILLSLSLSHWLTSCSPSPIWPLTIIGYKLICLCVCFRLDLPYLWLNGCFFNRHTLWYVRFVTHSKGGKGVCVYGERRGCGGCLRGFSMTQFPLREDLPSVSRREDLAKERGYLKQGSWCSFKEKRYISYHYFSWNIL